MHQISKSSTSGVTTHAPARLRTSNELLADGLIKQAEYNDLRRKMLAEL